MADTTYPQSAEQLIQLAEQGQVPKEILANMLEPGSRRTYLEACAAIERRYTEACDAAGDPCLASGCSMDHEAGEICLQPLLRSEEEYQKACATEWAKLFRDPRNRAAASV